MARPIWKLPYIASALFRKKHLRKGNSVAVRCRHSVVPAAFADKKVRALIFNGVWFLSRLIQPNMVGHKFGEFAFTKRSDKQTHLKRKVKKKPKGKK